MEKVRALLEEQLNEELVQMVFSGSKGTKEASRIKVRPILLKDRLVFQAETFRGNQAFHANYTKEELVENSLVWLSESFKQLQLESSSVQASVLVSKKGKATLKVKRQTGCVKKADLTHNKKKRYLLTEGTPVDFLVDLGVMTPEGRIVHARYDKFRQINRFLEFIEDILPALPKNRELTILDFGCGKSYLTFAMYYYLKVCRGYDIHVIGLDLKEDVIAHCNAFAEKYHYDKLEFLHGNIADYEGRDQVDMVVTLHACDTATDFALYKAVKWNARVILSVPCCQHELNGQIQNDTLEPVFRYGLLKERMAALITDGLRANLLEQQGYETQILEFIDMEHTPKNILIRAVKRDGGQRETDTAYKACADALHVSSTLERLLKNEKGEAAH